MQSHDVQNRDLIRSTIASGLRGHKREADIEKFYEAADSLVRSFEESTKLSIADDGVLVTKVSLDISSKDPAGTAGVAYNRRHSGLFPFPHDHCTVELCWDVIIEGERMRMCIEIEYPCNIDWPIIGQL